jgi:DNA end-binding protein Ku
MHALWKGALTFGLVNIPVRLYSASQSSRLDLDMLHKEDLSPIRYARICRRDGKEVPYDAIVKGYEYEKGDYVILTEEDFERANVRRSKAIEIQEFVDGGEIDAKYYCKPYFLEPEEGAERPYALLRDALARSKKVGIAKFVLTHREHLGAIKSETGVLILNQLRFPEELRTPKGLNIPDVEPGQKEMAMAMSLIEQLTAPFTPEEYKDTYTGELTRVIEQKAKGHKPKPKGAAPAPTRVTDLMAALKKSLEQQKQKKKRPAAA